MIPIVVVLGLLLVLVAANEWFRSSKWATYVFYGGGTIVLSIFVWFRPGHLEGTTMMNWFEWAKVYSVVIAVLGFNYMRHSGKPLTKLMKYFPALILTVNILEAVGRDIEFYGVDNGAWHLFNAAAGIMNIVAISGWLGIYIEDSKKRDMIWKDLSLFWVIAYDIWNFTYVYFCLPEHIGYGIAHILSATLAIVFFKKNTWIQARAYTLGLWMMILFTFAPWLEVQGNYVEFPRQTALLWVMGLLSFAINFVLIIWHFNKASKKKGGFKLGMTVHE